MKITVGVMIVAILLLPFYAAIGVMAVAAPRVNIEQPHIPVNVTRVLDGDTIQGDILLPFDVTLRGQRFRACDYDAWESSKRRAFEGRPAPDSEIGKGKAATAAFEALLAEGQLVVVQNDKEARDSFGRWLVRFTVVKADGPISVAAWMKYRGHIRK